MYYREERVKAMNSGYKVKYWQLLILSKMCEHSATMLRMADPNYSQDLLFDWLEDSETLRTKRQAYFTLRRVADLVMSSDRVDDEHEMSYEEFLILSACFSIIHHTLDFSGYPPQSALHSVTRVMEEVDNLTDAIKLLRLKFEDMTKDFEEGNQP